jgi:hypothetical protein
MEKLIRAEQSSDLGEAHGTDIGDVDLLRAAGAAAQDRNLDVAIAMWRLVSFQDRRSLPTVIRGLQVFAARQGWDVKATSIAKVIAHSIDRVCQVCHGRGHAVLEGSPVLAEENCPACRGSGIRDAGFTEREQRMADYLGALQGHAHHAISDKLHGKD